MCDFCSDGVPLWAVCCDVKLIATFGACDKCYENGCWTAATRQTCYDCDQDAVGWYGDELMCADCRDDVGYCCCGVMDCEKDCDGKIQKTDLYLSGLLKTSPKTRCV